MRNRKMVLADQKEKRKKPLPPLRHMEYVNDPYSLVDSTVDAPAMNLGDDAVGVIGRDFWPFLREHPKLLLEYRKYREAVTGKDFVDDRQVFNKQDETLHDEKLRKRRLEEGSESREPKKQRARSPSKDTSAEGKKPAAAGEPQFEFEDESYID